MNIFESHLSADETRVTVGGLLKMAPPDVAQYMVIGVTRDGKPTISVSHGPAVILPLLALVQGSLIRDVLGSRLCPDCQQAEYDDGR